MSGRRGWVPANAAWWPAIAEGLAQPWPREAMLMDLRWWSDQAALGLEQMPSRRHLARRWGVTEWQARTLLRAEDEWSSPARRPVPAQSPPSRRPTEADHGGIDAAIPPTRRPPAAQSPPHARQDRRPQTTDLRLSLGSSDEDPETPAGPAERLWEVWRSLSPARGSRWPKGSAIRAAIREHGEDTCRLVIEWLWTAPDSQRSPSPLWLREHMAVTKLAVTAWRASNRAAYVEQAMAWDRLGRPATASEATQATADPSEALLERAMAVCRRCEDRRSELREEMARELGPDLDRLTAASSAAHVSIGRLAWGGVTGWQAKDQRERLLSALREQAPPTHGDRA